MPPSAAYLTASEAARRLGISVKDLRLYERRGLVTPTRTAAGWRTYGPDEMKRAADIAALRALGFSLSQIAPVMNGDAKSLELALAAHQSTLDKRIDELVATAAKVRALRHDLDRGEMPTAGDPMRAPRPAGGLHVAFDLPWPWGGERFELCHVRPLTYITGPARQAARRREHASMPCPRSDPASIARSAGLSNMAAPRPTWRPQASVR